VPIAIQLLVVGVFLVVKMKFVVVTDVIRLVPVVVVPTWVVMIVGADEYAEGNVFVTVPLELVTQVPLVI